VLPGQSSITYRSMHRNTLTCTRRRLRDSLLETP
jgi:hypothetical protein